MSQFECLYVNYTTLFNIYNTLYNSRNILICLYYLYIEIKKEGCGTFPAFLHYILIQKNNYLIWSNYNLDTT
jgi:hypothetical protein